MRKIIACLAIILITFYSSTVLSEGLNLTNMDYMELRELKQQVDKELYSRSESKPFVLLEGTYEIGKDILPGRYYALAASPKESMYDSDRYIHVYPDKNSFDNRDKYARDDEHIQYSLYRDELKSIDLKEGEYIWVYLGSAALSVSEFKMEDVFTYDIPEGTYVPAGQYIVGEDIPSGTYQFYSGTWLGGQAIIYASKDDMNNKIDNLVIYSTGPYQTCALEDGNYVVVTYDVVMRKQQKLVFD